MKQLLLALGLGILAFNAIAQCPTYGPQKKMASSFHSSIIITSGDSVRYWGQAAGTSGSGDVLVPATLTGYSGTPISVAASSVAGGPGSNSHQLFLHTSAAVYGWGASNGVILGSSNSAQAFREIFIPVPIAQVSFIESSSGGLALVTNTGAVWVRQRGLATGSAATPLVYGDSTTTLDTNWHKVRIGTTAADTLTGVVSLSFGGRALMALTGSGTVYVWGDKVFRGNGSAAVSFGYARAMTLPVGVTPTDVNINARFNYDANAAAAAQYLLGNDTKMYSLGENYNGALGIGNETDQLSWQVVKAPGGASDLTNIVQIGSNNPYVTAVYYNTGALTSTGNLYLWGDNARRMLSSDTIYAADSSKYLYPHQPANFTLNNASIGYFEMGGHTTAAFLSGSSKFCYVGHKINGSMGDGFSGDAERWTFDCINTPEEYICPPSAAIGCPLPSAKDIVASSVHATLVINGQPTAAFWGQAASSAEPGVNMPAAKTLFEYNGTPLAVAASGTSETLAPAATQMWLQTDLGVWGWGWSANTIKPDRAGTLPMTQMTLPSGVSASQVSFIRSSRGGLALVTTTGAVYVIAGANSACSGRVYGDGSTTLDAAPGSVWHRVKTSSSVNLSGVIELSFSGTSALAITNSGTAYVWGDNVLTGSGSAANQIYATLMTLHSDFSASMVPRSAEIITSPGLESVIVMLGSNNKMYTLGRNANGALGISSSTFTTVSTSWNALSAPVGVRKLSSNNAYANGYYSLAAITLTGNVYLWGSNDNGMLGFGATANITVPTVASGIPANDATAVEIGGNQSIIFSKASAPAFYFAGHVQGGSKGDGTADGTVTSYTLGGSVANCANVTFDISGNLYNDVNGLTDNLVNGAAISTLRTSAMYANLLDESGYVIASTPIVGGAYSFSGYPFANYYVQISPTAGTVFSLAPTTPLPDNWVNVGEQIGTVAASGVDTGAPDGRILVALSANRTNVNFGVEQKPTPNAATLPTRVNPNGTATANISSGFTGVDTGGTITKVHITSFPTNATSIKIGTTTYTSGTWPPAGVTYTVAGTTVELDPIDGAVTSLINFKVIDNADVESSNSAALNVPFILVPPVAINVTTQAINSHAAETAIPQLLASSPMGTAISSYTVTSVPTAAQGVLYYCATFPPTCTSGGYTAITAGTTLTPNQAASLFFDPAQTFTGNVNFNYYATDANSLQSNSATYTIPVYNEKPVTQPIRTTQIIDTMHAAPLPDLRGADADGTVVSYTLNSIPSATQGVLSYCSTADEPCTGVVTTITSGTTISPAQMKTLKFDPTLGFSGDYVFQYVATDDNGNVSSPSPFAIPVVPVGTASGNQPPIAENVTAQVLNSSWGRTAIPNMLGTDPDGSVISYTIGATIPNTTTEGTLYYCASAPCTLGTLTVLSAGAVLNPTQAASIHFDPVQGFIGTASFTYTVLDNGAPGLTSNVATYNIPVSNNPPIANPTSTSPILNTKVTPTLLPTLSGSDQDGTVVSYNITSVPAATDGTLKYCVGPGACTAGTLTTISGPISGLTPAQAATLNFIPSATFTGNYVFNYVSVDNNGLISQPAPVTVPVIATAFGVGEPPVAYSFNAAAINSSSTASLPTALTGTDPDGTVVNYTLRSIPISTSGTLTYCTTPPATGCGTATAVGTILSPAQAATLLFTPASTFKGIASFTYTNKDNDSNLSNTATVTIPVNNAPPQALNIANPAINRTAGPATLNPLSSSDIDGTVVSYTIQSIPSADQGVLSLCTTPPATGCTPVTVGQVLTPAQISRLAFNPDTAAYVPVISFMYSTLDNSGNISNLASVDIPILNALDLPVELISFSAVKQGDRSALISWITGVEEPGVRYQLMHGTDGKSWSMINEQNALSANGNNYFYQHQNVNNGTHYYRLRILDAHKSESFSPVRTLSFNNGQAIAVTCQPNPASEKVYLSTSDGSELSLVEIYSNEGRRVKAMEHLSSGASIDLSDCAIGLYLIKATDAQGQTQVIKISKR
jgi:alpha-tubulin suppressor-like RCC1 family protein